MKFKPLSAAIATTLMGLSAASFAQTTPGTRGPAGGTTGQDNPGANEAPATGGSVRGENASAGASGAAPYTACDNLTGLERDRCLRDNAGREATPAYIPQRPSQSMGPQDPMHPNTGDAGQARSRGQ